MIVPKPQNGNCLFGLLILIYHFGLGSIRINKSSHSFGFPHFLLRRKGLMWHFTTENEKWIPTWQTFWFQGKFQAVHIRHYNRWKRTHG